MPINKKNAPSEIFNALQKEAQHHHHEAIEHDDEEIITIIYPIVSMM
ncbi:MAG: hypothetical protein H6573_33315 [Lewinellaceae bacterium]|nr:hypothetical protein [Lewinellaceae bacterium]